MFSTASHQTSLPILTAPISMWHGVPLEGNWPWHPLSPFIPYRKNRQSSDGAHASPDSGRMSSAVVVHPVDLEIHSPQPRRPFQTAEFLDNQRFQQGDWNTLLSNKSPWYDSPYDASNDNVLPSVPFTPLGSDSPLSLPPWPSTTLSLSISSLGLYPSTPSPLYDTSEARDQGSDKLFEYLSLTRKEYKKSVHFDPFSEDDATPQTLWCATPESIDLCTLASSDASFYSVPSTPESNSDMDLKSDLSSPKRKSSLPSPSSPATSINSGCFVRSRMDAEADELELFREVVRLSTMVLSLDERKGCMEEEEWKAEMGRVLALWKRMYAKSTVSERLTDSPVLGCSGD